MTEENRAYKGQQQICMTTSKYQRHTYTQMAMDGSFMTRICIFALRLDFLWRTKRNTLGKNSVELVFGRIWLVLIGLCTCRWKDGRQGRPIHKICELSEILSEVQHYISKGA